MNNSQGTPQDVDVNVIDTDSDELQAPKHNLPNNMDVENNDPNDASQGQTDSKAKGPINPRKATIDHRDSVIITTVRKVKGEHVEKEHTFDLPKKKKVYFYMSHLDEEHEILAECGADSWRYKALVWCYNPRLQRILFFLLMLDLLIIFTEMLLDAIYPFCTFVEPRCFCATPFDQVQQVQAWETCVASASPEGGDFCTPGCSPRPHSVEHAVHILHAFSITILSIFFLENLLLMVILRCWFWRNALLVVDFVVVTVAIILETLFSVLDDELAATATSLLVIVRMWRILRIAHGLVVPAYEKTQESMEEVRAKLIDLQSEVEAMKRERELMITSHAGGMHSEPAKFQRIEIS